MSDLYTDGGVISCNPSPLGGTFAWCLVDDDGVIRYGSGVILPREIGKLKVSNNVSELYAALAGLSCLRYTEPVWSGTLYTDSSITLRRLTEGKKFSGIPAKMRLQCLELRRGRRWVAKLVKGHPTQAMLTKGYACNVAGKQVPVSIWNVWCDKKCRKLASKFLEVLENATD